MKHEIVAFSLFNILLIIAIIGGFYYVKSFLQKCVKETKFADNHKVTKYFARISLNMHVWFLVAKIFQISKKGADHVILILINTTIIVAL